MAVAFQAKATAVGTASGVLTIGCTMTVSAGSNLALVAALCTVPGTTITSVKWDTAGANQTMTLIKSENDSGSSVKVMLYGLVNPTPGASKLVTAIWTTSSACAIDAISFTGVNQTGGATSFANSVGAQGTGTAASTGAITSSVNDYVCGVFADVTQNSSSVDHTSWWLDSSHLATGGNYSAGASTVTLGAVFAASCTWAAAGVDVVAAAAAATPKYARLRQYLRR